MGISHQHLVSSVMVLVSVIQTLCGVSEAPSTIFFVLIFIVISLLLRLEVIPRVKNFFLTHAVLLRLALVSDLLGLRLLVFFLAFLVDIEDLLLVIVIFISHVIVTGLTHNEILEAALCRSFSCLGGETR